MRFCAQDKAYIGETAAALVRCRRYSCGAVFDVLVDNQVFDFLRVRWVRQVQMRVTVEILFGQCVRCTETLLRV